jgi:hypothetical protein
MTVTVNDLALQVRRKAGDWGAALMTLDTQMAADATTMSVASRPDVVDIGQFVEVDVEEMEITDVSTNIIVTRAAKGTSATIHESGAMAIVRPRFTNLMIVEALVRAQRVLAGSVPAITVTTTHTVTTGTEEYALPTSAEYLDRVEIETSTSGLYRNLTQYEILDQYDPPRLRIPQGSTATGRTLRITSLSQYGTLSWGAEITDIPAKYHQFLTVYATGLLMEDELATITGQTEQAHGTKPVGTHQVYHQQVARNLQASAFAHLQAVRPLTRVVHRPDKRVLRK